MKISVFATLMLLAGAAWAAGPASAPLAAKGAAPSASMARAGKAALPAASSNRSGSVPVAASGPKAAVARIQVVPAGSDKGTGGLMLPPKRPPRTDGLADKVRPGLDKVGNGQ